MTREAFIVFFPIIWNSLCLVLWLCFYKLISSVWDYVCVLFVYLWVRWGIEVSYSDFLFCLLAFWYVANLKFFQKIIYIILDIQIYLCR